MAVIRVFDVAGSVNPKRGAGAIDCHSNGVFMRRVYAKPKEVGVRLVI